MGAYVDRRLIRQMHELGLSSKQMAETLGCTETTIFRIRKQLGISPGQRMTPELREKVQAALDEGQSWMEIQRTLGVQHSTMKKHFPGTAWTKEQTKEHVSEVQSLAQKLYAAPYNLTPEQKRQRA